MKIKLLDTELFVLSNKLQEITNPIILDRGSIPTPDGLLSTEIFGTTPKDRKTTFAYIDLLGHYLQPLAYKILKKIDRRIDSIIGGTKKYIINKNGELIEDDNGNTGIDWLYDNWEKLKFKRNESSIRGERIDLFELNSKKELFTKYCIVIPAFYRDINLQNIGSGKPSLHEINVGSDQTNGSSYGKLLRLITSVRMGGAFTFALNNTKYQIQLCLVDIYNYFKSRIEKKFGIIKKGLMGKNIDYGSRMVIAAPHFTYESPEKNLVNFHYCGLPLVSCISNATPFFIGWLSNFFRNELEANANKYPVLNEKNEIVYIALKNPAAYFNDDYCEKLINKFIKSYSQRFDPVEVPSVDGKNYKMVFSGKIKGGKSNLNVDHEKIRYMTLTDLFYIAAVDIYKDKHVIISRYPITSFQSLFTIRVRPLSTQETCKMEINGIIYPFYPVIDLNTPENQIPTKFIEILMISNIFLEGMNADYDGDVLSVRTVFSQEANIECEKLMHNPTNLLSANGTNFRTTTNEAIQTLYNLTK